MEPILIEEHDRSGSFSLYFLKLYLNYNFGDYRKASEYEGLCKKYLGAVSATYMFVLFYFYRSLNRIALIDESSSSEQKKILKKIAYAQKKIKKWAHHAPMNHLHKYNLVEAEIARVKGNRITAIELYKKAINGAHENGFIQEEALAYELGAKLYLEMKDNDLAAAYMAKAYECYEKWGARAKSRHLSEKYRELLKKIPTINI